MPSFRATFFQILKEFGVSLRNFQTSHGVIGIFFRDFAELWVIF